MSNEKNHNKSSTPNFRYNDPEKQRDDNHIFFETSSKSENPKKENRQIDFKKIQLISLISISVILVIAIFYYAFNFFFVGKDHYITLKEQSWERRINIEEYRVVKDDDWCSDMPSDAYNIHSREEIRHYREVEDGMSCKMVKTSNGDGTFSNEKICEQNYRRVPVYENYCHYSIDRWKLMEVLTEKGSDQNPVWPSTEHLTFSDQRILGNIRLGSKNQQYSSTFISTDEKEQETVTCKQDENYWKTFSFGYEYKSLIYPVYGISCDSIIDKFSKRKK